MRDEIVARIDDLIVTVRGQRVILGDDLAWIYGVETRVLNQAVRRNAEKFPSDFMFQLTREEARETQRLRSQIVILKRGQHLKYLPFAFTEHGAIMAANVLNSPRAVQMSVFVVRAFVRMRATLTGTRELARKLAQLERELKGRIDVHESAIVNILERVLSILNPPRLPVPRRRKIGFRVEERRPPYGPPRPRRTKGVR
ncbi:MAG TPA: ORF6N domain-containing protein [Candidatus Methylomirabilis sp.]|nr:ORF6N domain-containing protein [Candidatus Methylomirabilis sp.]